MQDACQLFLSLVASMLLSSLHKQKSQVCKTVHTWQVIFSSQLLLDWRASSELSMRFLIVG